MTRKKRRFKSQKPRFKKPSFLVDADVTFKYIKEAIGKKVKLNTGFAITGSRRTEDSKIYDMAISKNFHIITGNILDFKKCKSKRPTRRVPGIVGLVTYKREIIIRELKKMIKKFPRHEDYENKLIRISKESTIENGKTKKVVKF